MVDQGRCQVFSHLRLLISGTDCITESAKVPSRTEQFLKCPIKIAKIQKYIAFFENMLLHLNNRQKNFKISWKNETNTLYFMCVYSIIAGLADVFFVVKVI